MFLNRYWQSWLVFGLCLAVLLSATGWITVVAVWLDRKDAAEQAAAELEENIRLALWRMDSALTPLIAQENARTPAQFTTYYPVAGTINSDLLAIQDGQIFAPSPLVAFRSPYIRLHFQVEPDGTLTSPQAPTGATLDSLRARYGEHVQVEETSRNLSRLRELFQSADIAATVPALDDAALASVDPGALLMLCSPSMSLSDSGTAGTPAPGAIAAERPADAGTAVGQAASPSKETGRARNDYTQQMLRSSAERSQRVKQSEVYNQLQGESNPSIPLQSRGVPAPEGSAQLTIRTPLWRDAKIGGFRLSWCGDELLMMRRVATSDGQFIQGCWFDWPELRQWFLSEIHDLLPQADLAPVGVPTATGAISSTAWSPNGSSTQTRLLAAAPIQLIPASLPSMGTALASPTWNSLIVAWACVLLAIAAAAVLLKGTLALSQRRADFVSAVTHELRTPLTTFRMYTQMLTNGMVRDEPQRARYLETLRRESDRLGHLVENVLSYARLESGRPNGSVEDLTLGQLLDRVGDRLRERAEQAGSTLLVQAAEPLRSAALRTDATAVGQILFNLVDNACKYACIDRTAIAPAVTIAPELPDGLLVIRVQDNGPGISPATARRLFRPFHKSAESAAQSAPGVGLGLALSRSLARSLGGDLVLETGHACGCSFVLSLPR